MKPTTIKFSAERVLAIEYAIPTAQAKGFLKPPVMTETGFIPPVYTVEECAAFLQADFKKMVDSYTAPVAVNLNPAVAQAQQAVLDAQQAVKNWDSSSNVVSVTLQ